MIHQELLVLFHGEICLTQGESTCSDTPGVSREPQTSSRVADAVVQRLVVTAAGNGMLSIGFVGGAAENEVEGFSKPGGQREEHCQW